MGERPKSFIFYDLETSGKSPKYDQPLQFAAIVTDENFNELKRVNVRCKLAPHILPSPIALYITGVSPEQLYDDDLPNAFEFAQFLQAFIKENSPATWIGYNSIAFDENFLRQFFYQNLQPDIYATQSFGNDRLDVMKIVWAVYEECNSALKWPLNEKGKVSFKLEHLAPANGFLNANSHDALSDVEATIFLMNEMRKRASALVDNLIETRAKSYIKSLIESGRPLKVTLRYGGPPKTVVGSFCGYQKDNRNSFGFLDLYQNNTEQLLSASYDEVYEAATKSPQRIKCLALNKADTIRLVDNPDDELIQLSHKVAINQDFQFLVGEALSNRFLNAEGESKTVEEQIYDGFTSSQDKTVIFTFNETTWSERQYLIEKFEDQRLKTLARRLITFYGPQTNYENWNNKYTDYLRIKWIESSSEKEWNTLSNYEAELNKLIEDNVDRGFIESLEVLKLKLISKAQARDL